ncbi:MAG: hypothetical protein ACJA08_003322 [Cyclobacteriaceae bacterium]|jgi:hypothetical protein
MKLLIDVLGWVGSIEVIIAYFLISSNKVTGISIGYQLLNLTGAAFLIVNTIYYGAYPSSLINIVWVGIAGYALIKMRIK